MSFAVRERLDKLCLEFEDHCRNGHIPEIVSFLQRVPDDQQEPLLYDLLLIEIEYRRRRDEPLPLDEYRRQYAHFPAALMRVGARVARLTEADHEGQRVGRYLIGERIGEGAFGAVYRGWDEELGRTVAIKVPRVNPLAIHADLERVITEARTVAKLRHPHIVSVFDVVRDDKDVPLLIMEYVAGSTLRHRIEQGPMDRQKSVQLIATIAEAIDFAHRAGFVHRDLEPGNILLDEDDQPHVSDFGLALHESVQGTRAGESAGSLAYMSPEQVRGESHWLDGRADVWALGVMLYEMLVGRLPFCGETLDQLATEILCREPKPLRQIDRGISPSLEQICLRCLEKDVSRRFATAGDLATALLGELDIQPQQSEARRATEGAIHVSRRWWLMAAGAAALAGIGGAAMIRKLRPKPSSPAFVNAELDLRVWRPGEGGFSDASIRDPFVLPLRPGDQVRIEGSLDQACYAYFLWIDARGRASPVFPWLQGDWKRRPEREMPMTQLTLPLAVGEAWEVEQGPAGTESVVLLARPSRLPLDVDLPTRIGSLASQQGEPARHAIDIRNGAIAAWSGSRPRAMDFSRTQAISEPALQNQQRLIEQLNDLFSVYRAVCFGVQGHSEE